eukprot:TRINITY_DN50391_c0_g1_i1.p1 TRINITY_DN50391_c0_g1~~TRINITY_DN50391_c0_g1_i1.p1  ORF type:complete len:763 (+),score=181.72 TRINITY_DN50391_c0_g1_i1:88-2289(+)
MGCYPSRRGAGAQPGQQDFNSPFFRAGRPPLRGPLQDPRTLCMSPSGRNRAESHRRRGVLPSGEFCSDINTAQQYMRSPRQRPPPVVHGTPGVVSHKVAAEYSGAEATRKRETTRERRRRQNEQQFTLRRLSSGVAHKISSSESSDAHKDGKLTRSGSRRQHRTSQTGSGRLRADGGATPDVADLDQVGDLAMQSVIQIKRSWNKLCQVSTGPVVGRTFYVNLFSKHPEVQELFHAGDVQAQGNMLWKSLNKAVTSLPQTDSTKELMFDMGQRHRRAGVQPAHFNVVGNVLLSTFEQILDKDFTPEMRAAWKDLYAFLAEHMIAGGNAADDASDDGEDQEQKMASRVKHTWDVQLDDKGRIAVMEAALNALHSKDVELKKMFKVSAKAQAKKNATLMSKLIKPLPDIPAIIADLQSLGARHVDYGAEPWMFELFGECLQEGLAQVVQPYTKKAKEAWEDFYERISFYIMMSLKTELEPATEEHFRAVRSSWETLREKYGGNHKPFGVKLLKQVRKSGHALDALYEQHMPPAGQEKLAELYAGTFDTIFKNLQTFDADVVPMLEELAKKHLVDIGVEVGNYATFGRAFMQVLIEELDTHWTETLRVAWSKVYRKVSAAMIKHQKLVQKHRDKDADKKDAEWMYDLEDRGGLKGEGGKHSWKEVAKHNKPDDCWIVVRNRVYDVTKWLAEHPGGKDPILRCAGKDATDDFDKAHTGPLARGQLGDWYIAEVAQKK